MAALTCSDFTVARGLARRASGACGSELVLSAFVSAQERSESTLTFARTFLKNPRMLGSVVPSSRFLVSQLLRDVQWEDVRVIVECGPGVGTITRTVLERMRPDATLVAIELNSDFVRVLKERFADPRLRVVHASAADIGDVLRDLGLGDADCVIAGIPFSIMDEGTRERVLRESHRALRPGGTMLVYQFSSRVGRDLDRIFGTVVRQFEPRNILPARVFRCLKS